MRRIRTATVAATVAVLAALTACSPGQPDPGPSGFTPRMSTPEEEAEPAADQSGALDSPEAAAEKIGCSGYEQSSEPAPHVDEWGTCELDGGRVSVYYIPDDADYDAFVEAAAAWGSQESWFVRVGAVVAAPDDQTMIDQVRSDLEG